MNTTRPTADLGQLDRSGPLWQLRYVRHLSHSPQRVWRALTEPTELSAWFPTTIDGDRAAGAKLQFRFEQHEAETMDGVMVACEPPRLLEFMWGGDHVQFALAPTTEGTQLTLSVQLDENGKAARDGAGWHTCLDGLETLLDGPGGGGQRLITKWADVHPLYQQSFGPEASTIGPPEGHPAAS